LEKFGQINSNQEVGKSLPKEIIIFNPNLFI